MFTFLRNRRAERREDESSGGFLGSVLGSVAVAGHIRRFKNYRYGEFNSKFGSLAKADKKYWDEIRENKRQPSNAAELYRREFFRQGDKERKKEIIPFIQAAERSDPPRVPSVRAFTNDIKPASEAKKVELTRTQQTAVYLYGRRHLINLYQD